MSDLVGKLRKAVDRIEELETFITAEGDAHYSHREFEKMESDRDSWRKVAASTAVDVKKLLAVYEAILPLRVSGRLIADLDSKLHAAIVAVQQDGNQNE